METTEKDVVETPKTADSSPRMSQVGMRAMQGDTSPQPAVEISPIEKAQIRTDAAVPVHKDTPDGQYVEFLKLRGRLGEEMTAANIPGSTNVNDVFQKPNFPNYDVISPYEMSSVKVKDRMEDGSPRYADYKKYFQDISNPESGGNRIAAEEFCKLRAEKPQEWKAVAEKLPPDVIKAGTTGEMAQSMSDHSALRIPGDQVGEVQAYMAQCACKDPAAFGLDPKLGPAALEQQAQRLSRERIRSINRNYSTEDFNSAAAQLLMKRHPGCS